MFSRLVRFVTSLAIVGAAYLAYWLVLAPWIEPAAKPRTAAAETDTMPAPDARAEQWQAMFPPGSWELDRPKVLDTDRGMLLLKELRELDQYRLELKPCTVILFSGGEDREGSRPVILQAGEGAVLTFDEPVNLARGQIGRLARGTLPGSVTIRSPESRPGAADQLEVVTNHVQMTRERIETAQPITFRYGNSYGSGRDLIIHLALPVEKRSAGGSPAAKQRLPGVASAELVHVDRIRLQLDNPKELAPAAAESGCRRNTSSRRRSSDWIDSRDVASGGASASRWRCERISATTCRSGRRAVSPSGQSVCQCAAQALATSGGVPNPAASGASGVPASDGPRSRGSRATIGPRTGSARIHAGARPPRASFCSAGR